MYLLEDWKVLEMYLFEKLENYWKIFYFVSKKSNIIFQIYHEYCKLSLA